MILDLFLVYSFIKRLATPFKDWKAFKLGIIDENGKILKSRRTLATAEERSAFGVYDVMILNLKKTLAKVPGGSTKVATYAAALYLIKEWNHFSEGSMLTEDLNDVDVMDSLDVFVEHYLTKLSEDGAIVNAVGGGNIAGIGVGPQGEPGLNQKQRKKYKDVNTGQPLKRFKNILEKTQMDTEDTGDAFKSSPFKSNRRHNKHSRPMQPGTIPLT